VLEKSISKVLNFNVEICVLFGIETNEKFVIKMNTILSCFRPEMKPRMNKPSGKTNEIVNKYYSFKI